MKKTIVGSVLVVGFAVSALFVYGHCQVPCGIYGDETRFVTIAEHITTIEKSMQQIETLSAEGKNYNQIVRWVNNKEKHADELAQIVTYYFMAQRVKPSGDDDKAYTKKLVLLHQLLVLSMKAKQGADATHVAQLRKLTHEFHGVYFGKAAEEHLHTEHSGSAHK